MARKVGMALQDRSLAGNTKVDRKLCQLEKIK